MRLRRLIVSHASPLGMSMLRRSEMADLKLQSVKVLRDGHSMPVLGLGTYLGDSGAFGTALELGYRLIDTASLYDNEQEVGQQIKKSGVSRRDIFVVTKVWNSDHGRQATIKSLKDSLKRLDMDYVDMFLMHSVGGGKVLETWDAMVQLRDEGLTKSIGVANFNATHLKQLKLARPDQLPAVNQIEIHPFLAWDECVSFCEQENIAIMAYSPLAKAMKLKTASLTKIANKYDKTSAQVMIRWSLQRGFICIPKSSNKGRIAQNADVFDFHISDEDMQKLNSLDEHFISDWPGIMMTSWEP